LTVLYHTTLWHIDLQLVSRHIIHYDFSYLIKLYIIVTGIFDMFRFDLTA